MPEVFVLLCSEGEYEERTTWVAGVYSSFETADKVRKDKAVEHSARAVAYSAWSQAYNEARARIAADLKLYPWDPLVRNSAEWRAWAEKNPEPESPKFDEIELRRFSLDSWNEGDVVP